MLATCLELPETQWSGSFRSIYGSIQSNSLSFGYTHGVLCLDQDWFNFRVLSHHISINRCLMFESTSRDQIPTRYFSIFLVPLNLAYFIPSPCELHWKWRIDFSPFWKMYIQGTLPSEGWNHATWKCIPFCSWRPNDELFFSLPVVYAGTNDRVKSPNRDVGAGPQHGTKWWFNYNNRLLQWRVW